MFEFQRLLDFQVLKEKHKTHSQVVLVNFQTNNTDRTELVEKCSNITIDDLFQPIYISNLRLSEHELTHFFEIKI